MRYEFKCINCRKVYEIEIPMSEYNKVKDQQKCEKCGQVLNRVFEPIASPIYNCGGFYCKP